MTRISSNGYSRREFLDLGARATASSTLLGLAGSFGEALAASSDSSGYKALVCLYMTGGNNGFNTVVPTTTAGYQTYQKSRSNLALAQGSLLSLNGTASDGYAYGLNANCTEMQKLFNAGHLAVIGNVGTLVQPTTMSQARSAAVPLPWQLFSHADQQNSWWTSIPNRAERYGWAGRIADLYTTQGYAAKLAMNINIGGVNYWQEGRNVTPYVLGNAGAPVYLSTSDSSYRSGRRQQAALDILSQSGSSSNLMVAEYAAIQSNAAAKVQRVNDALNAAGDLSTSFPSYSGDNQLGLQLHEVARVIKARSQIGDTRQLFFVRIDGFDTHNNELSQQGAQLRTVSRNLDTFFTAMNEIGQQNNVTVFTASDFGRSLGSNGDGSDHAWGNHHFVMGGAVRSGYYGTMPSLALNGADDMGNGRVVPTTSTDTYSATLARWFGVTDTDLDTVFPNLANFGSGTARNLGFLG